MDSPDFFSEAPIFPLQVAAIVIPPERQRKNAEADDALIASIEQRGLLNAIIVRGGNILIAGERRLDAFRKLNKTHIPARNFEDLSEEHAMLVELQENIAREQLNWQDEARAVYNYHLYKLSTFPTWTIMGTAQALGWSETSTHRRITVAAELSDPDVAGCLTLTAAHNFILGRAARTVAAAQAKGHQFVDAVGQAFEPLIPTTAEDRTKALLAEISGEGPPIPAAQSAQTQLLEAAKTAAAFLQEVKEKAPAEQQPSGPILHADFLEWAANYDGPPFDVIHCDFPYGKDFAGSNTTKQAKHNQPLYDDSAETLWKLLRGFLSLQSRFVAPQAHCFFWHDRKHEEKIVEAFEKAGWRWCTPYPAIWTKGNAGTPGDYKRGFRHCYEQAHLFSLGDRRIIKLVPDHFAAPVETEGKLHLSQKSVPMLKHFLSALCDEHTRFLDPTCGSGSSIAAANLLQVDYTLGIELDEANATIASFFVSRRLQEGEGE